MENLPLFIDNAKRCLFPLGSKLSLEFTGGVGKKAKSAILYRQGVLVKYAKLSDHVDKRLFIVDAVNMGAKKSYLAKAFNISRQTIDNYINILKYFGKEGLIHGYRSDLSKSRAEQRKLHKEKLATGNKAHALKRIRKAEGEERSMPQTPVGPGVPHLDPPVLDSEDRPFAEEHGWEKTRYAGSFVYLPTLIAEWKWLSLVMRHFGDGYRIFMVFILMAASNIRSVEQLKHVVAREAGLVLGIRRLPSKPKVWEWFYNEARKQASGTLLTDFFRHQVRSGLVGISVWFTDGHLLPYTGKHRVHSAYNTQRRMPVPGRTGQVTCDGSGRIIDFTIEEGKGDMRAHIASLGPKWREDIPQAPVHVFDREGHGAAFFANLIRGGSRFVTWEKHVDTKKLDALDDSLFATEFELNGKLYGIFEGEKTLQEDKDALEKVSITLRRIYLWNKTSKRRTCGLAWTNEDGVTTKDCALAILSRWGASENTFKHLYDRHPWHYHPGFKLGKSERQDIANPELKEKNTLIASLKKGVNKLYRKLSKANKTENADGTPRQNSNAERLKQTISEMEMGIKNLNEQKKELSPRIDVSTLEDYSSFKRIDNEGKYLFDFVTISVWNARKQMVDWLTPYFNAKDELVDLFYAITNCHGWIKSTRKEVTVRLEPLQQPRTRLAQEQLCRKLTSLMARTPNGKRLVVEVGESPL